MTPSTGDRVRDGVIVSQDYVENPKYSTEESVEERSNWRI
jgi:hypothetical protein